MMRGQVGRDDPRELAEYYSISIEDARAIIDASDYPILPPSGASGPAAAMSNPPPQPVPQAAALPYQPMEMAMASGPSHAEEAASGDEFRRKAGETPEKVFPPDARGLTGPAYLSVLKKKGTIAEGVNPQAMGEDAFGPGLARPIRTGSISGSPFLKQRTGSFDFDDAAFTCTYVIHAHGGVKADALGNSQPLVGDYSDIRFYSPVSCLGPSLYYNQHTQHQDSTTMIKSSCPGNIEQAYVGQQYALTNYQDIPGMVFYGEGSTAAHTTRAIPSMIDGEKKLFYAGVYRCIGNNNFDPDPLIRINVGEQVELTAIIEAVREDCRVKSGLPEGERVDSINLIVATCLSQNP